MARLNSQVQGDNMKNTSLFMMFTLLGVPGFVIAASSDLANAEYNFAVNELSLSSLNQTVRQRIRLIRRKNEHKKNRIISTRR